MLQDLIGTVLVYIFRLFFIDVQTYGEKFPGADAGDQILRLHQAAPGGIDQHHAVFHLTDGPAVDHMIRFFCQRAV